MRKYIYRVHLKELLKLFKSISSSDIHMIDGWLNLLFIQSSSLRKKEKKRENSNKACMGTLSYGRSLSIYKNLVCGHSIQTIIIMSISTNIHRTYVCDPLGPYISLVNNFIDPITPYWSTLIIIYIKI